MHKERLYQIYQLVHKMSKEEKRFFKKNHDASFKYIILFDTINGLKKYDRKVIVHKLLKSKVNTFQANQIPDLCTQLYSQIMRSIRNQQTAKKSNIDIYLKRLLIDAEILLQKQYWLLANKIIKELKTLCSTYQRPHLLPEILRIEKNLQYQTLQSFDQYHINYPNFISTLSELTNQEEQWLKYFDLQVTVRKSTILSKKDIDLLKEHPPIQHTYHTLESKLIALAYHGLYYFALKDYDTAIHYNKELHELILSNESLQVHIANTFQERALHNLALIYGLQEKFQEAQTYSTQYKTLRIQTKSDLAPFYVLQLSIFIELEETKQYQEKIDNLLKEAQDYIEKHPNSIYKNSIRFAMLSCFFWKEDFNQALTICLNIINERQENYRDDVFFMARILEVIIHYEKDSIPYVRHRGKATLNYLNKKTNPTTFEITLLQFTQLLANLPPSKTEKQNAFTKLYHQLNELKEIPHENKPLRYFNFIKWAHTRSGLV